MFWPGAFIAASLLVSIAVPIADAATNGVDPTVRTAAESFVQQNLMVLPVSKEKILSAC